MSVKLEQNGIASFYVYSIALGRSISSGYFSKKLENIKFEKYNAAIIWTIIIQCIMALILALIMNQILFIVFGIMLGLTTIVLYAFPLKMILDKNTAGNTMKYSAFFHFTLGLVSATLPYFSSLIIEDSVDSVFILVAIALAALGSVIYFTIKRAKIVP